MSDLTVFQLDLKKMKLEEDIQLLVIAFYQETKLKPSINVYQSNDTEILAPAPDNPNKFTKVYGLPKINVSVKL